jgi:hypothetical protein
MQRARATAAHARRRHALSIALPAFAAAASIAGGFALLVVIADRLIGLSLEWWMPVLAAIASGLLWSTWCVSRHALSPAGAAALVDERLRLHDKISSALELAERADSDVFAAMATEQGDEAAHSADVRVAIPIRLSNAHLAWTALTAAAVALLMFAPQFDLFGSHHIAQASLLEASDQQQAHDALQDAGELIDELALADPGIPEAGANETDARDLLDELDRQLTENEISPDVARSKASGALSGAAQLAADRATQEALREEALREMLSQASDTENSAGTESEGRDAADALREALAAGDLDAAHEALESIEQLPEDQQELAADQLEHLAEQLEELAALEAQEAQQLAQEQLEQLRDAGLDEETAQRLSEMRDEQEIEEELREQGKDEESAHRLAEQTGETNRERTSKEHAAEDAREMAEAAEESAEELREEEPEAEQSTQDEDQPEVTPGEQEGAEGEGESQDGEQQQGEGAQQPQDGEREEGEGESQGGEQQQGESAQQPQPGAQEGEEGAPQEVMQEGEGDEQQPGGTPQDGGDGAGGEPRDLREMLERMEEAREQIEADEERAQRLRERAEEMLDEMSPEQREEMERWAEQLLIEDGRSASGYDYSTESVDARPAGEELEVREEWFNPDGEVVRDGAVSREEMIETLRTAAEGAERAIEEQRVPARSRHVRRYFERALKRAEEAQESTAPEGALGDG